MSKKKYRLEPVLMVRDKAKQDAAQHLATCRELLTSVIDELKRREDAVVICRREQVLTQENMFKASSNGMQVKEFLKFREHLANLRIREEELLAEVEQQKMAVSRAEKEVEKATECLIEAAKEVQVIEKHQEAWLKESKRNEDRREQKFNDEIGSILKRGKL
jgi:flagellar export protein FliJ